jgi:hypothetical protein
MATMVVDDETNGSWGCRKAAGAQEKDLEIIVDDRVRLLLAALRNADLSVF